jgi:hypothetical protein
MLTQEFTTDHGARECKLLERLLSQVIPAPVVSTLVDEWALEQYLTGHFMAIGLKAGRQSKDSFVGQLMAHKAITEEKDNLLRKADTLKIQQIIETKATGGFGLVFGVLLMPSLAYQN